MSKQEEFIKKAIEKHGQKYDYSKVKYITSTKHTIIIHCKECNVDFEQLPSNHLKSNNGHDTCSRINIGKKYKKTQEDFIKECVDKHGDKYDYSKTVYKSHKDKVIIICKLHGEFEQVAGNHAGKGSNCPLCARIIVASKKTKTLDKFIEECREVHGDTYDYSKVDYINNSTYITIICKKHGEYTQSPSDHLRGRGCSHCGVEKSGAPKKTQEQFVKDAIAKHGAKYDYSKAKYEGAHEKVLIVCNDCKSEFYQEPSEHTERACGCPICASKIINIDKRLTKEQFLNFSNIMHDSKYDYSLIKFENTKSEVEIICPTHGIFIQSARHHIYRNNGCPKCGRLKSDLARRLTTEQFIERAKQIHGDKYDYSKSVYKIGSEPLIIICNKHDMFLQTPSHHLMGSGCKKCYNNVSRGSIEWLTFLSLQLDIDIQHAENEGEYSIDYSFYKADGYCEELNTIFEYNGCYWHGCADCYPEPDEELLKRRKKTEEKRQHCIKSGFKLIEIYECKWKNMNDEDLDIYIESLRK
jgi:hypothetical protein